MPDIARPLLIAVTDRRLLKLSPEDWAREAISGGVDLIQVREKDLSESDLVEFASRMLDGAHLCDEQAEGVASERRILRSLGSQPQVVGNTNIGIANESRGSDPGLTTKELFQSSTPSFSVSEETSPREHGVFRPVLSGQPRVQINNARDIARLLDCGLHLPESEPIPERSPRPLSRSVHSIESAQRSTSIDFLIAGHIFATPSKSGLEPRGLEWLGTITSVVDFPVVAIGGINAENAAACVAYGASGVAVISAIAASDDPHSAAAQLRTEIDRAWGQRYG